MPILDPQMYSERAITELLDTPNPVSFSFVVTNPQRTEVWELRVIRQAGNPRPKVERIINGRTPLISQVLDWEQNPALYPHLIALYISQWLETSRYNGRALQSFTKWDVTP